MNPNEELTSSASIPITIPGIEAKEAEITPVVSVVETKIESYVNSDSSTTIPVITTTDSLVPMKPLHPPLPPPPSSFNSITLHDIPPLKSTLSSKDEQLFQPLKLELSKDSTRSLVPHSMLPNVVLTPINTSTYLSLNSSLILPTESELSKHLKGNAFELRNSSSRANSEINLESEQEFRNARINYNNDSSTKTSVSPGIKDSDGFLTPPPASTLLIRRSRSTSTPSPTFIIASPSNSSTLTSSSHSSNSYISSNSSLNSSINSITSSSTSSPSNSYPSLKRPSSSSSSESPYDKKSKKGRGSSGAEEGKRRKFEPNSKLVTLNMNNGPHFFQGISPLAIDPSHSLSLTLSSDRSISTVVPLEGEESGTATTSDLLEQVYEGPRLVLAEDLVASSEKEIKENGDVEKRSEGEGALRVSESRGKVINKGRKVEKRRRGERGPDKNPNIDPLTGRRRYIRKKRFSFEKRPITSSRARLKSRLLSDTVFPHIDQEFSSKWRPTDDLRLIINVLQTNDLELVYRGVKFSCKFTLENIDARWSSLLYDKSIAKVSQIAIRNLHPKIVADIYEKALFSQEEDDLIATIKSSLDPSEAQLKLEELLNDNALVFLKWRSPKSLFKHWQDMKEFHLLCDQNINDYYFSECFSYFEDSLTERDIVSIEDLDPNVRREIQVHKRNTRRWIRRLEEEVGRWQVMADMVTEIEPSPFEESSYAMLRGRQVRYLMRSEEITLGRRTSETQNVDADLCLEGSTYKVSRKQATIRLLPLGQFVIFNQGKHAIYVNGSALLPKKKTHLVDQSVIEISYLSFIFLINTKIVSENRRKKVQHIVLSEMKDLSNLASAIKSASIKTEPPCPSPSSSPFSSPVTGLNYIPSPSSLNSMLAESNIFTSPTPPPNISTNSSPITTSTLNNNTNSSSPPSRLSALLTSPLRPPSNFVRAVMSPTGGPTTSYAPRIQSPAPIFRKPAPPPVIHVSAPSSGFCQLNGTTGTPSPSFINLSLDSFPTAGSLGPGGSRGGATIPPPLQFGDLLIRPGLPPPTTATE